MKCKNCGANYKTRELICPYCQTENVIGKIWMAQRSEAEREYIRAHEEYGKKGYYYVINRAATRVLVILLLLLAAFFVGTIGVFLARDTVGRLFRKMNHAAISRTMQDYYDAREMGRLYAYMDQYDLIGQDNYTYSQAALLGYSYDQYFNHKLSFLCLDEDEKQADDFHLEYALRYSIDVYLLDEGLYSEPDPANEDLYQEYRQEIMSFWTGTLGLSEDEITQITESGYIYSDDMEALIARIKERRAWE